MPLSYITKMAECDCCFVDPTGQKQRKESLYIAWQELGKNGGKCKMRGPQSALSVSVQRFDFAVCNSWALLFSEEATLNLVTLHIGSSPSVFYTPHDQDLSLLQG